jgi:PAS domain S-box-containing protein
MGRGTDNGLGFLDIRQRMRVGARSGQAHGVKGYLTKPMKGDKLAALALLEKADSAAVEYRQRTKSGDYRWIANHMSVTRDETGRPLYREGNLRDITEGKQAEAALRESERFSRSALNALTGHIAVLDETGTILLVNQAWRTFARENALFQRDAGVGVNYLAVCDAAQGSGAEAAAAFARGIRAVMRGEQDLYEQEYDCHAPQAQRWFIGRVTRFQEPGPVRIVIVNNDITERRRAEEERRKARELFQKIFDASPIAMALSRLSDRTIVDVNAAMENLLSYPRTELAGQPATHFDYWADPQERQRAFEIVREGPLHDYEFSFKTRSGRVGQALNYTEVFEQQRALEARWEKAISS